MSLFVFNNQQKLIKSIPNRDLISVVQDQAINVSDTLFVEMPADIWSNLKEPASYLAVQDPYERFSYHMYKVSKHTTKADTTDIEAVQVGYDELKAYGYIKDRRFNNRPVLEAGTAIVDGTDWQLGYVDTDLPNVNTNFYYISRLEALSKLIEATGAEVRFRVEISGNKIIAKRLDLYKKLGIFKGKRFAYGSNLLEIIKEEDTSELYTALVGRGKGEETDTGGFGRRITFADIAWSKANGKPVDKPLGQEFIELPEMTAYYGYPDGEPRTGIVEFGDIEEPEQLLKATYERLVETSRPQVQFKAKVQTTGDMQLGEEVAIIRSDLGFRYKTRVFRVKRDYLNNMFTEVELGDKLTETLASRIKKIDTTNARREETIIQYIQTAANGKNKIFRGPIEPTEGMMVNDLWYKPVGEGETMLYTWNGEIWELSKVSAGLLGGTLDAESGDVNLINVNVSTLVGNISEFVRSYWNAVNSQILIDGNAMQIINPGRGDKALIKQAGMTFLFDGIEVGRVGMNYSEQSTEAYLSFSARNGQGMNWAVETGPGTGTYDTIMEVPKGQKTLRMQKNINLNGNSVLNALSLYSPQHIITDGLTTEEVGKIFADGAMMVLDALVQFNIKLNGVAKISVTDQSINLHDNLNANGHSLVNMDAVYFGTDMELRRLDAGSMDLRSQEQLRIVVNGLSMFNMVNRESGIGINVGANINMQGNDITQTSDERLKENIVDSQYDAMGFFRKIKPRNFDWIDKDRFGKQTELGLIAQELKEIEPRTVTQTPDTGMEDGMAWAINETEINKLTWMATHQLVKENDTLKQELADLKAILSEKGLI